jgi:porin
LTQFFSRQFGLFAGKINMLDSAQTEFYGDYRTQFLNAAFNFPMTLEQVPISAFGGDAIVIPQQDILLSALALDPDGTPTSNDLGHALSDGVEVLASGKLTIKPFGLVGHQSLGLSWNNKQRFSLIQDPTNTEVLLLQTWFPRLANPGPVLADILTRFVPALLVPALPPNRESSSWALSYSFDQYFWQPDGNLKHGIGLFFGFGASDGNPNPIQYTFITGAPDWSATAAVSLVPTINSRRSRSVSPSAFAD